MSSTAHGRDHISQPEYRNVSIITAWNSHKDEINCLGCERFARETGQNLMCFYSEDFATEMRKEKQDRKARGFHRSTGITDELQQILWDLPPNANDGQFAGTLRLCIGMPVMIRNNYATELCMTKGQEGVVHSWQVAKGSRGQQMLDVLFIELLNPPSEVQLMGLPKNVVPLERKTITVNCKMPNDKAISLSRSQVDIAPNFAMTDYSLQGKTRPYNPVHLDYCKSHQACYTALSRTASAKGTILLQPISPSKVQGGVHGSLRQEFRELEMLDEITRLRYERCLHLTVRGDRRYTLLDSYRKIKGEYYVPSTVHPAIVWSRALPFEPTMVEDILWQILTKGKKIEFGTKPKLVNSMTTERREPVTERRIVGKSLFDDGADKPVLPSHRKRKSRISDTSPSVLIKPVLTKKGRIVSRSAILPNNASAIPYGTRWSNNSCAFDTFFAIFFNMWHSDVERFKVVFLNINPDHLGMLSDSFQRHLAGAYNLNQVRDLYRRTLHRLHPQYFVWGQFTSLLTIIDCSLKSAEPYVESHLLCSEGHISDLGNSYVPVLDISNTGVRISGIQSWILAGSPNHNVSRACMCGDQQVIRKMCFLSTPSLICFEVGGTARVEIEWCLRISTGDVTATYDLVSLFYFGQSHFVARFVDRHGVLWFQDGAANGGSFVNEGYAEDHYSDSILHRQGMELALLVYLKRGNGPWRF